MQRLRIPLLIPLVCIICAFAVLLFFYTHQPKIQLSPKESDWLNRRAEKIVVINGDDAPPFIYTDENGKSQGFLVDYQRELEKVLSYAFEVKSLGSWGKVMEYARHNRNHILTGVYGFMTLAEEACQCGDEVKSYMNEAINSMERVRNLTDQLRTFSKGPTPKLEEVDLVSLIREAVEFLLSHMEVDCRFDIKGVVPPVMADRGLIDQVVTNLVINAAQAMEGKGRMEIGIESCEQDNGAFVRFDVKDEGQGIDADHINRIFDPYFTTKRNGTGLGLATSFSIIQKHKGSITVNSEPGKGTTFSVTLPVRLSLSV